MKHMDWSSATDFESYVIRLFIQEKTESEEFQRLLRLKGRERMEAIWRKYKAGDYKLRDSVDAKADQPEVDRHQRTKETSYPKATSFCERSCPDDDF